MKVKELISELSGSRFSNQNLDEYFYESLKMYGFDSPTSDEDEVDPRYIECVQLNNALSHFCKVNGTQYDPFVLPILINDQYLIRISDLYKKSIPAPLLFLETIVRTNNDGKPTFFSLVNSFSDIYVNIDFLLTVKFSDIMPSQYNASKPKKMACTYIMRDTNTGYYKIGRSANPSMRERTLQSEKPTIKLIAFSNNNIERKLHVTYSDKRIRGEWFDLCESDVQDIISIFSKNN